MENRTGAASIAPLSEGSLLGGRYLIKRALGMGGHCRVWEAVDLLLQRPVAVKVLRPERVLQPDAARRLSREVRAAARLRGPHVGRVFDTGWCELGPFMVMELLDGKPLSEVLADRGRLDPPDVRAIAEQILDALVEAHALGLVHRDLKPSNVFVRELSHGRWDVKVLDFGVARWADRDPGDQSSGLTNSEALLGTPRYMAPEQMENSCAARPTSDVWAFGVMLFEMLTGSLPFDGESVAQVCVAVLTREPAALRQRRPELSSFWETVVARCLNRNPELRYASAAALLAVIQKGDDNLRIPARAASLGRARPGMSSSSRWLLALGVAGTVWISAALSSVAMPVSELGLGLVSTLVSTASRAAIRSLSSTDADTRTVARIAVRRAETGRHHAESLASERPTTTLRRTARRQADPPASNERGSGAVHELPQVGPEHLLADRE